METIYIIKMFKYDGVKKEYDMSIIPEGFRTFESALSFLKNTSKEDFHETKEFRTYSEDYGRRKYSIIAVHIFD